MQPADLLKSLTSGCAEVISEVGRTVGENKDYGPGIGPHDEDDQVDALVDAVTADGSFPGSCYTVKDTPSKTHYPGGQAADLVLEADGTSIFCEAKLFRFQRANGNPSPEAYAKVFSPYQDHSPRSFIHDITKLADSELDTHKAFLGIYYQPVSGAGTDISGEAIAEKFTIDVDQWTNHSIEIVSVAPFDGLQHDVYQRGAILTWLLDEQPRQWFSA
jgi:hypothetical protein